VTTEWRPFTGHAFDGRRTDKIDPGRGGALIPVTMGAARQPENERILR
jgi:hypothetical protein